MDPIGISDLQFIIISEMVYLQVHNPFLRIPVGMCTSSLYRSRDRRKTQRSGKARNDTVEILTGKD